MSSSFYSLLKKLKLYWIYFNRFIYEFLSAPYPSKYLNHILIFGDSFALGMGDWVTIGKAAGLVPRLQKIVGMSNLKQSWYVVNRGIFGTSSKDWLPKGSLFKKLFESKEGKEANIVIVFVGSEDARKAHLKCAGRINGIEILPTQTVDNIKSIVEGILQSSNDVHSVYVMPIPTFGDKTELTDKGIDANVKRNELLVKKIETMRKSGMNVKLGPNIAADNHRYSSTELYASDLRQFCSYGYERIANDLCNDEKFNILADLKKIEFQRFRKELDL